MIFYCAKVNGKYLCYHDMDEGPELSLSDTFNTDVFISPKRLSESSLGLFNIGDVITVRSDVYTGSWFTSIKVESIEHIKLEIKEIK